MILGDALHRFGYRAPMLAADTVLLVTTIGDTSDNEIWKRNDNNFI
jgi:hypothetical protein